MLEIKIIFKKIFFVFIILMFFSGNTMSDQVYEEGKKIFLEKGNCATCHALRDADSYGNIGPNLNEIMPDKNRVIMAVSNGIGVMPSYLGLLSDSEIDAVSTYVAESASR
tara:strand:+ start:123 stop:452 length:330 start_codon:yes stop_codon:yes gene_type:complete